MISHPNRSKQPKPITRELAAKILDYIDAGLTSGKGVAKKGQMCIEAVVCNLIEGRHADDPVCVAPALRSLKIRLNDSIWSSDLARSQGMRRLGLVQLGSAGFLDESEFIKRVLSAVIRKMFPPAIRAVAAVQKDETKKTKWSDLASRCEAAPEEITAREARQYFVEFKENADDAAAYAADDAADDAAADAAAYAAAAAAYAADDAYAAAYAAAAYAAYAAAAYAAAAAAYAADDAYAAAYAAAAYAADDAAYAADDAAAAYAAYAAAADDAKKEIKKNIGKARDCSLSSFCEEVVQILIAMKVPGVEWLDLAPLEQAA